MQNLDPTNPPPSQVAESKSARKKKAKAEAATNGSASVVPAVPNASAKEDSSLDAKGDADSHSEHPYIKDLTKQIRNVHKKLGGMQRIDAIVAENPGVSIDDLVASRKINADQKASIQKKPQLEAQLSALEEQLMHYKKFDSEFQSQLQKQKEELTGQHQQELEKTREDMRLFGVTQSEAKLREKLLVFSQFLRCAAAKRSSEEDTEAEENRAFEGALLLVYGGDEKAVSAAMKLIDGSEERVPSVDGVELGFTYSQIRQASVEHAPFQVEESWVDSVAEANATGNVTLARDGEGFAPNSDPTVAYAGLTELDTSAKGVHDVGGEDPLTGPPQGDAGDSAGNAAGDKWEATLPGADRGQLDDSYEMIPRPQDELETPVTAEQQEKTSWADDQPPSYDAGASGNVAGEAWDVKAAGEQGDDGWTRGADAAAAAGASGWVDGAEDTAAGAPQEDADGFQSVPGRHRGRGGRGRPGEDYRGRGRGRGGFRGDGEFRGRGRGGYRARGEGGEYRGRGGRGRPYRGNGEGLGMGRGA